MAPTLRESAFLFANDIKMADARPSLQCATYQLNGSELLKKKNMYPCRTRPLCVEVKESIELHRKTFYILPFINLVSQPL